MPETPMSRYRALVAEGRLRPDPAQRLAVEKLQLLHQRLVGWSPEAGKRVARGFLGFGRKAAKPDAVLAGLYLYGDVGRGKSMLMDLFFEGAPVEKRRRVHFHAFMQEVHGLIDAARKRGTTDPIAEAAAKIADAAPLLCFDEMQVSDIADAMILGRLFEALFARGVVTVTTSNRPPDDLYKDGLNRAVFLPFIAMLKDRLDLHELESPHDHRLRGLRGKPVYHTPLGPDADARMADAWAELTDGARPEPLTLTVQGRAVTLRGFAEGVGRARFADLCEHPLGAADYLAIAEAVETLMIDRIPRLGRANYDAAKRFVTLVDALYEARVRLVCSAAA
ncbi:MAG: AFG1 family ATPase, partial [Rhodobacteraceae bacterium]